MPSQAANEQELAEIVQQFSYESSNSRDDYDDDKNFARGKC